MHPPSTIPAPGDRVGPYRLGRRLGSGGMGVVHEAHDTVLDRRVALKLLAPALADDPAFRSRFTREARAQASLDSPHVVHVYAHGEAAGQLYLATQLVPDGDLGAMLRAHGPPPMAIGLDLVAQVASGLADAHASGLVHRDVKPANVLLRRHPGGFTAHVADFGLARPVTAAPGPATLGTVGTPAFMAPELHDGAPASVAIDVYALGCLLWTVLTGGPPYPAATDFQVMTAHRERPVPRLPGAGARVAAVDAVLARALAKAPEDRYADAAALRDDLRAALPLPDAPAPARAPARGPGRRPGRGLGRRRRGVAAVAVLALLGGGPATAYLLHDPPGPAAASAGSPGPSSDRSTGASDLRIAELSLAAALRARGPLAADEAGCAARAWIAAAGLEELAAAGLFDAEWRYVDRPATALTAELRSTAARALAGCVPGLSLDPPICAVASVTRRVRWQGAHAMAYRGVCRAWATQPACPDGGAQ